jgi:ketosteroid isomerase-like protein
MRDTPYGMSERSAEVVGAAFEAWQERGVNALLQYLAAEIEWEVHRISRTPSAIADTTASTDSTLTEVMDDMWFRPNKFIPVGDNQVVVPLTWGGRGKESGVTFEERSEAWIFTVSASEIVRVREFATREQAVRAAGLHEDASRAPRPRLTARETVGREGDC